MPDRVLNKSRKIGGKGGIELSAIEVPRNGPDHVRAAVLLIAGRSIRVLMPQPLKDAGAGQKRMYEGINGDHRSADLKPAWVVCRRTHQQVGECHHQDLVGDPVHVTHRLDNRSPADRYRIVRIGCFMAKAFVDPADQVPVRDIPNEQKQRIGQLVALTEFDPKYIQDGDLGA
jgi:hypothetical protein